MAGSYEFTMYDIDLDDKWRLKRYLFIMLTSECFGNSSVNHTCYFHTAAVLGHFTFQRKKKKKTTWIFCGELHVL